jgi:hypothetical protein
MSLTELPRAAWTAALNDFSTAHEGWLVSVEVWTPEIGALPEIANLPLIGVSADRTEGDGTITISAASSADGHASHTIHHAVGVTLERDAHGVATAMHIESAGGVKTTLRFRQPHAVH